MKEYVNTGGFAASPRYGRYGALGTPCVTAGCHSRVSHTRAEPSPRLCHLTHPTRMELLSPGGLLGGGTVCSVGSCPLLPLWW